MTSWNNTLRFTDRYAKVRRQPGDLALPFTSLSSRRKETLAAGPFSVQYLYTNAFCPRNQFSPSKQLEALE